MKWLSNAWNWLSGKKTALGAAMLMAADYIPQDKTAHIILSLLGQIFTGGGLAHKVGKSKLPSGLKVKVNQIKSLGKRKMKLYYGLTYETYHEAFALDFESYFNHLIDDEGGYLPGRKAKRIGDLGGATNHGISLRFLKTCKVDLADINHDGTIDEKDIVLLTKQQAKQLYFKYFWNPLYIDIKHVQLANRIFNFGVNAGKRTSVKVLQRTVNKLMDIPLLRVDGIFGRNTLKAVKNVDREKLYRLYIIEVEDYYRSLNKPQFMRNWMRRLSRLIPNSIVRKIKTWKDNQVERRSA